MSDVQLTDAEIESKARTLTQKQAFKLIDRWFDSTIKDLEAKVLMSWVKQSPDHADTFARASVFHQSLRQTLIAGQLDTELEEQITDALASFSTQQLKFVDSADLSAHLKPEIRKTRKRPTPQPSGKSLLWYGLTIAALLVIVSGLIFKMLQMQAAQESRLYPESKPVVIGETPEIPATLPVQNTAVNVSLTETVDVTWSGNQTPIAAGSTVGQSRLQIDEGLIKLEFPDVALLTVEGPADIEILDNYTARLHKGVASARTMTKLSGFVLETPSTKVHDLGTEFGVKVADAGITNVVVFDGEVELEQLQAGFKRTPNPQAKKKQPGNKQKLNQNQNAKGKGKGRKLVKGAKIKLKKGKAIQIDRKESVIRTVAFNGKPFQRSWSLNSGVLKTEGLFKFISPKATDRLGEYADDDHMLIFPEVAAKRLNQDVEVDIAKAGLYYRNDQLTPNRITKGTMVRTFLLQFNPTASYDDRKEDITIQKITGEIVFDHKILGVIVSGHLLKASDRMFSPISRFTNYNGLEYRHRATEIKGTENLDGVKDRKELLNKVREGSFNDWVQLKSGRRRLIFNLRAGRGIDHIRVIVEQPNLPEV